MVITDHTALTKLTNCKDLSSRMIRWTLNWTISNIYIKHSVGKENAVVDSSFCNTQEHVEMVEQVKIRSFHR